MPRQRARKQPKRGAEVEQVVQGSVPVMKKFRAMHPVVYG